MQVVQRPLMLSERMVALAAAVSVDYDYFSQHSHGSGWFAPMMFPPVPYPSGGGAEGGAEGGEGAQEGSGEALPGDAGRAKFNSRVMCWLSKNGLCARASAESAMPSTRTACVAGNLAS